jgi:hypothetical protein
MGFEFRDSSVSDSSTLAVFVSSERESSVNIAPLFVDWEVDWQFLELRVEPLIPMLTLEVSSDNLELLQVGSEGPPRPPCNGRTLGLRVICRLQEGSYVTACDRAMLDNSKWDQRIECDLAMAPLGFEKAKTGETKSKLPNPSSVARSPATWHSRVIQYD